MLNNLSTYLSDEEYRISILEHGIHVLNYNKIIDVGDREAILKIDSKFIRIHGSNFRLKRLDKKELLIEGKIKKVEINEF